uniref:Protein arginine N-methyltransferase domain-containing protein n=1 Tax=Pyramimonas obovata TaxID=1411642 RepID=A0A7S0QZC6_9CHLO|mmetsp:Transcript_19396/g.42456  ORF Transcript_19396/g.42456 Transcript_19396/m.42456 type:complete len:407 (+) Transcript_19396:93-1313(+)
MILQRVEVAEDGGHVLYVSHDPDEGEKEISQEELDDLVSSGQIPPLLSDTEEVAAQLKEAMQSGNPMELKLFTEEKRRAIETAKAQEKIAKEQETYSAGYYESYEKVEVHEVMLKDTPRNYAYATAIEKCAHKIAGKAVLDVGCGTGILSMLCAKAGARVVYAVEASKMAVTAERIVKDNNLQHIVKVYHCPVESVQLPEQVDVIISEWMGFYLLHESMLQSVLKARDLHLKPDGLMMPSKANVYAVPVSLHDFRREKIDFWDKVVGFDMRAVQDTVWEEAMSAPLIDVIGPGSMMAKPQIFASLDLHKVTAAELEKLSATLKFTVTKEDDLAGICCYFDTSFFGTANGVPIVLNTSPESPPTHWKQTVCLLGVFARVKPGEEVEINLNMVQDSFNPRHYIISLET